MSSKQEDEKEVLRYQLRSKATKNPADMELYELSQLSGITMDPHIFEILLDLLRKNVPPEAIVQMLRSMCAPQYNQIQQKNLNLTRDRSASLDQENQPLSGPPMSSVTGSGRGDNLKGGSGGGSHTHTTKDAWSLHQSSSQLTASSSRQGRSTSGERRQERHQHITQRGAGDGYSSTSGSGVRSGLSGRANSYSSQDTALRADRFVMPRSRSHISSVSDASSSTQSNSKQRRSYYK